MSCAKLRGDIQGLRAIAVLGVILFHANRDWLPGGFVGVDIFFVISGFLIACLILKRKEVGQFSFVDFYLARGSRIAPAYFTMLAAVTLCAAVLFIPKDFQVYWQSLKSATYFGSNNYFSGFGDYFAPSAHELPLLHTWSLAIEMQFYLLLPLLMVSVPERLIKTSGCILILALFGFGIFMVANDHKKDAYFSLLVRAPEFLIGAFLASFTYKQSSSRLMETLRVGKDFVAIFGLALIVCSFMFINENSNFPGALVAFPCIGAALVIAGHGGRVSAVLSYSPLVWIGGLSYSLYLWHWPVFAYARYINGGYEIAPSMLVWCFLAVFVIAYLSLRFIETPFRRKNWFAGHGLVRTIVLILGVFTPVLAAQRVNASVEEALPVEYTRYADPVTICHGRVVRNCLRGSSRVDNAPPILVLGDSHAAQLNLFFDRIGQLRGKQYRVISASSCATIPGFDVDRIPDYARKDCQASIDFAQNFIPEAQKIILAAMWQYQLQSESFIVALKNFLAAAQAADKNVTVLWQVPMLMTDVQRLRRLEHLGFHREIQLNEEWKVANQRIHEIAAQYPNVQFVDLSDDELFSEPPFYHDQLIFSDSHHLNEVGAALYADRAIKWFQK